MRLELAQQHPQQRGLAGAVGADDADLVSAHDAGRKIANDRALAVGERDSFDVGHQRAAALTFLNGKLHLARRALPLGTRCWRICFERSHAPFVAGAAGFDPLPNPDFFLGQSFVEQLVLLFFGVQRGFFADQKRVVIARPVEQPPAIDLQNAGRQLAQETSGRA